MNRMSLLYMYMVVLNIQDVPKNSVDNEFGNQTCMKNDVKDQYRFQIEQSIRVYYVKYLTFSCIAEYNGDTAC